LYGGAVAADHGAMTDALVERPLTGADLAAATALSEAAGWNQVAGDWRLMLADGAAIGLVPADAARGRDVVATALTVPLGERLAWISMVLVDPAWRRRGLGTRLLGRCVEALRAAGVVPGLDATPAGQPLYAARGFTALFALSRFGLPARGTRAAPPAAVALRPLTPDDLGIVAAWDTARTGMARAYVLAHLRRRLPDAAWLAMRDGRIAGYVLGRDGRMTHQLGPLVAEDAATARALLAAAWQAIDAPAILDVPDVHAGFQAWLAGQGAARQRPYTRMVLGPADTLPPPESLFALAGPELG
jgi:GNAT superfamily N-acetyltransferase